MDYVIIDNTYRGYVVGMGRYVLFVESNGKAHTTRCILHVVMWVEPTHYMVIVPQAAHAKKISVEVRMVYHIV